MTTRRTCFFSFHCCVLAGVLLAAIADRPAWAPEGGVKDRPDATSLLDRLPLGFEANRGQADERFHFLARGAGLALLLSPEESVLVLSGASTASLRMRLVGGSAAPALSGLDPLPGHVNYFMGSATRDWRRSIPTYGRVRYKNVYPGVDLIYRGGKGCLEYDFILAPGADPDVIRIEYDGSEPLRVDASGDLLLHVGGREIVQRSPVIYQEVVGGRTTLPGRFVLRGHREVGFAIEGQVDRTRALVIDPVLAYSTYLGGTDSDSALSVAADSAGNVYVTGQTLSYDFPLQDPLQPSRKDPPSARTGDVFVTKMDPSGGVLIYSTYLGGSMNDIARGIAVDGAGSAYITGTTESADFPVANALQPARAGVSATWDHDAFVAKLSPDGSSLVYSTYLGGGLNDDATAIAVDGSGGAYVAGNTNSLDFPVAHPLQPSRVDMYDQDAFVAAISAAGDHLVFSTSLGGGSVDNAAGIAVDATGDILLTGYTNSSDFPTVGPLRAAPGIPGQDAFVAKLEPAGAGYVYCSLLGGAGQDQGLAIAADAAGNAYVGGITTSPDFPIRNPAQPIHGGTAGPNFDAFATKIDPQGTAIVYSTFLGGGDSDSAYGIAVDGAGQAMLAGSTSSADFPEVQPIDAVSPPSGFYEDLFVTKLSADGAVLAYSTRIGGTSNDWAWGIAAAGNAAYVAGATWSRDFPTTPGAFQPVNTNHSTTSYIPEPIVLKVTDDAPPASPRPLPGAGRVEQDDPAVVYAGPWFANASAGHSGGSSALAIDRGARAIFTFKGTGVRWIGSRDAWSGIARVFLDGVVRGLVDTYGAAEEQAVLFESAGLADEIHTLVVEVTGTQDPASGGAWIWVDAFDVLGPEAPPAPDTDSDGVPDALDCAPLDASVWRVPSPAEALEVDGGPAGLDLTWQPPRDPGGGVVSYDVLRSSGPADFTSGECVASSLAVTSLSLAPVDGNEFYLIRSRNACGGNVGRDSSGSERPATSCP